MTAVRLVYFEPVRCTHTSDVHPHAMHRILGASVQSGQSHGRFVRQNILRCRIGVAEESRASAMRYIARPHEAYAVSRMEVVSAFTVRVLFPCLHQHTQAAGHTRVKTFVIGV